MRSKSKFLSLMCALLILFLASSGYSDDELKLKVGDSAPVFVANDQDGNLWKSSDYIGKGNLVVYFYPVALTGG